MADKVLIANVSAQREKYGLDGYHEVRKAIGELIAADMARGLKTVLVDISNPSEMKRFKSSAVLDPSSERQNKNAVDRIYTALRPHYVVLLDGPDVIPHILLKNPWRQDVDKDIPSDLPYASDEPFSTRHPANYAAVTRVIGRIPGVTGTNNPAFLVSQLKTAAVFKSRPKDDYLSHFAISTYTSRKSTRKSVDNVFRNKRMAISPPASSPNTRRMLDRLSHFINCEGRQDDPTFYGKRGSAFVPTMTSDDVSRRTRRHTVVAAECCFGAQLFAPSAAQGKMPIASAYLNAGAIAFFGSTNVAYGARNGNGCADLITQYFLSNVLESASIGRACLEARQKYVYSQEMEDPVNLKTLAQFILLGDPSLQAVRGEQESEVVSEYVVWEEARRVRRISLSAAGKAGADCSGFPRTKIIGKKTRLHKTVLKIALQRGFSVDLDAIEAYEIRGGDYYRHAMRVRGVKQSVFVATHRKQSGGGGAKSVPLTRILVAHAQNGRLTGVSEYVRR
jgi:Peptidase family C25